MNITPPERTALYRFFRLDGSPLYFGITNNPKVRFANHARNKTWWPDVDHSRTRIEWFATREEAETAELDAIRAEKPEHNIVTSDENGCARFLPNPRGRRWGRPKWAPTAAQQVKINAVVELRRQWREAEEEYKRMLVQLTDPAGADVPVIYLARRIGIERKTIYRHIGRPMQ